MNLVDGADRFHLAQCLHQGIEGHARELDKAEMLYNDCLNHNVGNPDIIYSLGVLNSEKGNHGLAIQLLSWVVKAAPEHGPAWNSLALAANAIHMNELADEAYGKAQTLMPDEPVIPSNRASMRINQGVPAQALDFANQALKVDPNFTDAKINKSLALLEMGAYHKAWELYEYRIGKSAGHVRAGDHPAEELPHRGEPDAQVGRCFTWNARNSRRAGLGRRDHVCVVHLLCDRADRFREHHHRASAEVGIPVQADLPGLPGPSDPQARRLGVARGVGSARLHDRHGFVAAILPHPA